MKKTRTRKSIVWVYYVLLGICLVVFLFPLYWGVVTAFKVRIEFFRDPPTFWPLQFTWQNFIDGWRLGGGKAVRDSAIVALSTTGLSVCIGVLAAYSIARWNTGGKGMPVTILSMRMLPPVLPAIAFYLILRRGFLLYPRFDTYLVLICLYSLFNIPFVVWIMRGFFVDIPVAIEESALLAGVSRIRILWDIVLPLAKPGLVATALLCIMYSWNEFLFALFLTSQNVKTLPKLVPFLVTEQEPMWGAINAVGLYGIIPMVIMGFFLQKYLVRGLSYGALKG